MTKLANWEVSIEYGPTAADVHYVTVKAESFADALEKGMQWAEDNRIQSAMVTNATELQDLDEDFTDIIEWTQEEEEEFIRMLDIKKELE